MRPSLCVRDRECEYLCKRRLKLVASTTAFFVFLARARYFLSVQTAQLAHRTPAHDTMHFGKCRSLLCVCASACLVRWHPSSPPAVCCRRASRRPARRLLARDGVDGLSSEYDMQRSYAVGVRRMRSVHAVCAWSVRVYIHACLGDVVDIVLRDPGHRDAPVARQVDGVLGTQLIHMLLRPVNARA